MGLISPGGQNFLDFLEVCQVLSIYVGDLRDSENEDHGIWSHHFMGIDGETVETGSDFILGGSKITADGDCSHEIKRHLTPWKKSYDQPRQHIKKQISLCQQRSL